MAISKAIATIAIMSALPPGWRRARSATASLALRRRLFHGGFLVSSLADLVEADIDYIGGKRRARGHREAQILLDIGKHHIGLVGGDVGGNAFEFGSDGLGVGAFPHHRIAQRHVDRSGTTGRPDDDPA